MSEISLYLLLVDGITSSEQLILLLSSSASSLSFIVLQHVCGTAVSDL